MIAPPGTGTYRTVLIEDDSVFRQLLEQALGKVNNVEVIGNFALGADGLECCRREKPDLLVVDLMLPDTDGLEIVREVRASMPETKIIVITGNAQGRLPNDLLALGVNGYVHKSEPISFVLEAVESVRSGGLFFAIRAGKEKLPAPVG